MNIRQKIFTSIVVSLITIVTVFAAVTPCNKCGPNRVACKNETAYAFCSDGVTPSKQIGNCAIGLVCTDGQPICQPRATATKVCGSCDTCASGFKCTSRGQFEYCKGASGTGIKVNCPTGQVCSIANVVKNHNICVKSCLDEPTCYAADVSTTPAPTQQQDYTKSCVNTTTPGNYANLADSSCKSYVFCELLNGAMNSVLFQCNNAGYYSATDRKCVGTKPNKCT